MPIKSKPKHNVFVHLTTYTHDIGLYFINNTRNNNKRVCLNNGLQTAAPTAKPYYRILLYYTYNHNTSTLPAGAYILFDILTAVIGE